MVCCSHESRAVGCDSRSHGGGGCSWCLYKVDWSSDGLYCLQTYNEQEEKSIVCYFTNWAWYRKGRASFRPENINATLCTHIIYAFASLDNVTSTIVPSDPWTDIDNKFYELVTAFKNLGLKVLISIGGWNNSAGDRWHNMFTSPKKRAKFVASVVKFLKEYNFDGLDMDYEYPSCPQGNRTAGKPGDKKNFNKMMSELKTAFNGEYLLTVATAGGKKLIEECSDIAKLCDTVDWFNVMNYEYHSSADGETGAQAPVCGTRSSWGVVDSITYYIKKLKVPPNKLVMGVPFYSQTFTMVDSSPATFGVKTLGPGTAGTYTANAGTLSYYETCLMVKDGYEKGHNKVNGSYIFSENQFISYDSMGDIIRKCCLIKKYNLKGAMFWALDYDDFNNLNGCGSYPLLKTLNQQLRCNGNAPKQCC